MKSFVRVIILFLFFCGIALGIATTKIPSTVQLNQIDCQKRPNFTEEPCCKMPKNLIPADLEENCLSSVDKNQNNISQSCMFAECIFTKSEVVQHDKVSIREILRQLKKPLLGFPTWSKIMSEGLEKCITNGLKRETDLKKQMSEVPYNLKGCNPIYNYYLSCISVYLIANCPTVNITESATCSAVINFFQNCPEQYPPVDFKLQ